MKPPRPEGPPIRRPNPPAPAPGERRLVEGPPTPRTPTSPFGRPPRLPATPASPSGPPARPGAARPTSAGRSQSLPPPEGARVLLKSDRLDELRAQHRAAVEALEARVHDRVKGLEAMRDNIRSGGSGASTRPGTEESRSEQYTDGFSASTLSSKTSWD